MTFDERLAGLAARAAEAHAASDGFATDGVKARVRRGRRVRAAVAAAGAVAAVAVAGFVGTALADGWRAVPPAETTAPTPPEPTATPAPQPTSDAVGVVDGWADAGADAAVFGGATIMGAVEHLGRAVVVGCTNGSGTAPGFPVWVAQGAGDWVAATGPEPTDRDGPCLRHVVSTPHGVYAAFPALYRSDDGYAWTRVDIGLPEASSGSVVAVFAVGDRVTALVQHPAEAESRIATLHTTTDGDAWQLVDDERARLFDNAGVAAVVVRPDGGLLAVGASPGGEFVPTAAAWTSDDGLTWRLVTARGDGFADCGMSDVVATPDGYTAVGYCRPAEEQRAAVWTSPDGTTWADRTVIPDGGAEPAPTHALAVTKVGDVTFAAGSRTVVAANASVAHVLWRTEPDDSWVEVPADSVVPVPFHVIQVGGEAEPGRARVGFWSAPYGVADEPVRVLVADE